MSTSKYKITSEWEGLKGKVGGWYLNSYLRRISELLLLGDLRDKFLEKIDLYLKGNETVLDIGAGSGYFTIPIANRLISGKVIGLDLSLQMLGILKRAAQSKKLSSYIDARLGNAYQLDINDSSIDLAVSNGVFHELSQPQKALSEIKRVLKSKGRVILTDFRDTPIGKRIGAAHHPQDHGPFSVKELKELLAEAGFVNVIVEEINNWVLGIGQKK